MSRQVIDWERIEADYRAGLLSVREIAASQGVSHTAIQKKAKAGGWDRDLAAKIKAKADALVARAEVATKVATETTETERAIIEAGAEAITSVRLSHRKDIARSRALANALLAELESQTADRELFEQLGDFLAAPDERGIDKLNDLYKKVIALPSRVDSAKKLAETLKTLIALEREAYGIAEAQAKPDDKAASGLNVSGLSTAALIEIMRAADAAGKE